MNELPKDLALRLESMFLKSEMKILKSALTQEKRPVSFRINIQRATPQEIEEALNKVSIKYTKVDFPKNCYLLDSSFSESHLWKLKIYKEWKIYIQGVSSQIPVHYFTDLSQLSQNHCHSRAWHENLVTGLSEQVRQWQWLKILDACAAPGGKTAQLADRYPGAEIWAFEPSKVRYEKMLYNLQKQWIQTQGKSALLNSESSCEVTVTCIHDSIENIWEYIKEEWYFDLILIDAPCSSEWSISQRDTKFLEAWDISHINKNYKRQKRICDSVLLYLKDMWQLIYSTCTLAPEENEAVVHYLLCNYPELKLEKINLGENLYIKSKIPLKSFWKHPYKNDISENCMRVIPSEYSEGFFIAKLLRKC